MRGGGINMNLLLPTAALPLSALRVAAVKPAPTCICTLNPKLPLCELRRRGPIACSRRRETTLLTWGKYQFQVYRFTQTGKVASRILACFFFLFSSFLQIQEGAFSKR